jgi:hypothetical protein
MGRSGLAAGSPIKSIQRGYFEVADSTTLVDTTISSVNQNKAHVYANNAMFNALGYGTWQNTLFSITHNEHPSSRLTSDTNLRSEVVYENPNYGHRNAYVAWQVIEYW